MMMPQLHVCARPRPKTLELTQHSRHIVMEILAGLRSHKDLKIAFDWEHTPQGHRFWSTVRQKPGLCSEAHRILSAATACSA